MTSRNSNVNKAGDSLSNTRETRGIRNRASETSVETREHHMERDKRSSLLNQRKYFKQSLFLTEHDESI